MKAAVTARRFTRPLVATGILLIALAAAPVADAAVTANRTPSALAGTLAGGGGLTITGSSFTSIPPNGNPSAVGDSSLAGMPTAGSTFAVLSTGDATLAPNASQAVNASASNGGIARAGGSDRDAVVLK